MYANRSDRRSRASSQVAVVGAGPAGRALAHRLLLRGADVTVYDPAPDRPWRPTYGGWSAQLPPWLPREAIATTSPDVRLIARAEHRLTGTYVVLDNAALQQGLSLDGARVRTETVADEELPGVAEVVIDCRGNSRSARAGAPAQSAYGLRLSRENARSILGNADAVLMDWRPDDGSPTWGDRMPSFCYTVPVSDERVLVEETCLAGRPPLGRQELAQRLLRRLDRLGVTPDDPDDVEHVHFPMLPPPAGTVPRFGAAGGELNPITGYSVFASLAAADRTASRILGGEAPRARAHPVRRAALGAVLELSGDATVSLFDSFGHLSPSGQRSIFDIATPTSRLVQALMRQASALPRADLGRLVAATGRGVL